MGFGAATIVWWREQRDLQGYIKGKQIQFRGATEAAAYGSFSDDGGPGIDDIMHGSP